VNIYPVQAKDEHCICMQNLFYTDPIMHLISTYQRCPWLINGAEKLSRITELFGRKGLYWITAPARNRLKKFMCFFFNVIYTSSPFFNLLRNGPTPSPSTKELQKLTLDLLVASSIVIYVTVKHIPSYGSRHSS
jgi:hypothetical protein